MVAHFSSLRGVAEKRTTTSRRKIDECLHQGLTAGDRCFYISGHPPFEDSVKAVSGECSICARCDFPHREARGQALMSAHPNAAEQLAMTVFPLNLKALAIL